MNNENLKESLMLASFFLQYPDEQFMTTIQDCCDILENELDENLQTFYDYTKRTTLTELSENFVDTFDFGRQVNLYMAFNKGGDDRTRGNALIELKKIYADEGLSLADNELPDYLPLMLEFAACASTDVGLELLQQHIKHINDIKERLIDMDSPYAVIFSTILSLMDMWLKSQFSEEVVS